MAHKGPTRLARGGNPRPWPRQGTIASIAAGQLSTREGTIASHKAKAPGRQPRAWLDLLDLSDKITSLWRQCSARQCALLRARALCASYIYQEKWDVIGKEIASVGDKLELVRRPWLNTSKRPSFLAFRTLRAISFLRPSTSLS